MIRSRALSYLVGVATVWVPLYIAGFIAVVTVLTFTLQGGQDDDIATLFNRVPKYVASRGRPQLAWAGSSQLGPDLPAAVREIRDRHENIKVVGSLDLVQTLLREKLFDRLDLWIHPIVLGVGKQLFAGGAVPTNLTLLEPPAPSPAGTVLLRYGLADGVPRTGDMGAPDRGASAA